MNEQKPAQPRSTHGYVPGFFIWLMVTVLFGCPGLYALVSLISDQSPLVFAVVSAMASIVIWNYSRARAKRLQTPTNATDQAAPKNDQEQQNWSPIVVAYASLLLGSICAINLWLIRLMFAAFLGTVADQSADWIILLSIACPVFLVLWSALTERTLVRRMKQRLLITSEAIVAKQEHVVQPREARPLGPVPVFAINMRSAGNLHMPSVAAAALIQRAHQQAADSAYMLKRGYWCLVVGYIALAPLCGMLNHWKFRPEMLFSGGLWLVFGLVFYVLGTSSTSGLIVDWRHWRTGNILGVIFLVLLIIIVLVQPHTFLAEDSSPGLIAQLMVAVSRTIPPVLALITALILTSYALWIARTARKLRHQALAHRPIKLLFLWVFGSPSVDRTVRSNVGDLWQHVGSVQLLKGAGFMVGASEMAATLGRRADKRIAKIPDEIIAHIKAFRMTPDWMGRYHHNSILCGDAVWQLAFHTLLADTDVVLMNLSSFSPKNQGVSYELGQLIDRLPTRRFLLLVDATTDIEFLTDMLRAAWKTMAADSPNRVPDPEPVQIFKIEHFEPVSLYPDAPVAERRKIDEALQAEIESIFQVLCEGAV